jgi:hypothetical protein
MWELPLLDAHDHFELLLAQNNLLIIVLIVYRAQRLAADVIAREQRVEFVATL